MGLSVRMMGKVQPRNARSSRKTKRKKGQHSLALEKEAQDPL
jgi:hypothetical protein